MEKNKIRKIIKYQPFIFLLILMSLQLIGCKENPPNIDWKIIKEIKNFKLPIYPFSKNIEERYNQKYIIKSVRYDVDIYYPAKEVILFYDKEMNKKSFYHYVDDCYKEYDRTWQTYIDGTIKGEPNVLSLTTSWVDKNKSKRCTLVLRYFWQNKGHKVTYYNNKRKLKVEIYIKPFSAL